MKLAIVATSIAPMLCVTLAASAHGQTQSTATHAYVAALRSEARAHEHGEGVTKDARKAVQLYCDAARLGDAEAQFSLGWMYANGRGIPRDDAVAAVFFAMAARQGHEHAARMQQFVGAAPSVKPECLRQEPARKQMARQQSGTHSPHDFAAATASQKKALELVNRLAPEFGVHPRLALAVIRTESNFDPTARSPKNAQGLMQLIPETAARFHVSKPFDPVENVRGGLAYLRWLLAYFRGNVALVAAAYNAGEGAVNRYRGIPPYAETRAYVTRIMALFGQTEHPYDSTIATPSPELKRIRAALVTAD
jgi:soluble lytic murein transglycosylase-like protein